MFYSIVLIIRSSFVIKISESPVNMTLLKGQMEIGRIESDRVFLFCHVFFEIAVIHILVTQDSS